MEVTADKASTSLWVANSIAQLTWTAAAAVVFRSFFVVLAVYEEA